MSDLVNVNGFNFPSHFNFSFTPGNNPDSDTHTTFPSGRGLSPEPGTPVPSGTPHSHNKHQIIHRSPQRHRQYRYPANSGLRLSPGGAGSQYKPGSGSGITAPLRPIPFSAYPQPASATQAELHRRLAQDEGEYNALSDDEEYSVQPECRDVEDGRNSTDPESLLSETSDQVRHIHLLMLDSFWTTQVRRMHMRQTTSTRSYLDIRPRLRLLGQQVAPDLAARLIRRKALLTMAVVEGEAVVEDGVEGGDVAPDEDGEVPRLAPVVAETLASLTKKSIS